MEKKYIDFYQIFFAEFWNKNIDKYSQSISQLWLNSDYYADERTRIALSSFISQKSIFTIEKYRKVAKASMCAFFD